MVRYFPERANSKARSRLVLLLCNPMLPYFASAFLSLDAIGHADAIVKGAEAELAALKDEFKARGLAEVAGDDFTVMASEQIAGRLDAKAVKAFLGDGYPYAGV
jgi:hypothetical protein